MKKKEEEKKNTSKIESREITTELRESYLDYAMSVIVSRALPDVRDGLKPVQRRILWAMWSTGLTSGAKFKKSANVVGDVLGKYHPHGDSAIYDALARMAQDFSLRYPLIDGQGNWGSIDGDAQAAMRYCLAGDALVITDKGLVPIKELGGSESASQEKEINLKVLSKNRGVNSATKWFDSGEHPTIRIETNHGFTLKGSENHPVLVWARNPATGSPSFSWKLLSNLEKGDVVVIERTSDILWPEKEVNLKPYWPTENRSWDKKILPESLDENLAFILGLLVAEGMIKENKIEFCNSDEEVIKEFKNRWQKTFPDCRLRHFRREPNSFGKKPYQTLEVHSQYVIVFLRNIGLLPVKSAKRRVPETILRSPKLVVTSFLRAYFEGDGSVSWSGRMNELSLISTSEQMMKEVQVLLLRFGIAATKRFDKWRKTHKLYIRSLRNYILFRDQIDFAASVKSGKLEDLINNLAKDYSQTDFIPFLSDYVRGNTRDNYKEKRFANGYNFDRYPNLEERAERVLAAVSPKIKEEVAEIFEALLLNNYLFDPVVRVEKSGPERVYSLKVASECHSFVASGFVNHNTEARLSKIAGEMLTDIEKGTVDWQPNYDASREEPVYLPSKLPNLLINGTVGIAVGMATSIPPHNLGEVAEALKYLNDNPNASVKDLVKFVPGPDFPTGGIIYGASSLKGAYSTGRGSVTVRAVADIEEKKKGFWIVITEIPYQVNKANLIESIAKLHENKRVDGIKDVRDESDREGLRVVIEVKNGVPPQKLLNQLYQYSELQKNIYFNMIALVDGIQPETLSLKDILVHFLDHRKIVVRRRTEFNLRKAEERAHILEGLSKALGLIDKIIATIKKSKDREDAKKNLIKKFKLTAIQSDAILDMKLSTLAALERKKIEDELKEKKKLIAELRGILKSSKKIANIVNEELTAVGETFGGERRTRLVASDLKEFREEDLIPEEDVIITLTKSNYIKRMKPSAFRAQGRGGKGLIGFELKDEDVLTHFLSASSHDNVLFFTDRGKVYQTKAYEIPAGTRVAKGKSIHNFLEIPTTENISAVLTYKSGEEEGRFIVMATSSGLVKKSSLKDFENVRRTGIIAIRLRSDDSLKGVELSSGKDEVILVTALGQAIRFKEKEIRAMSRATTGVAGMRLKKGDRVIGLGIIEDSKEKAKRKLLVVTEKGFAKQTPLKEYKQQRRGGSGIKTAKIGDKTGNMIEAVVLSGAEEEVMVFSSKGQALRTGIDSIRVSSRSTQGVKIMTLKGSDKLIGIVCF